MTDTADAGETQFVGFVNNLRTTNSLVVAGLTVLIYDHLISLEEEVRLMWKRPWNAFSYLYFWSRYFTLAVSCVITTMFLRENASDALCRALSNFMGITSSLVVLAVDAILLLRVWILYDKSRVLFYLFLCLLLAELVIMLALVIVSLESLTTFLHYGPLAPGCTPLPDPHSSRFPLYLVPPLVVTLTGFFLTLYKCIGPILCQNPIRVPVLRLFLRDGALWFVVVSIVIVGGLVNWTVVLKSLTYQLVIPSTSYLPSIFADYQTSSDPQSRAYSIVASHVVLNIKRLLAQHDDGDTTDGGVSAGGPITFNVRRSMLGITQTTVTTASQASIVF